MLSLLVVLVSVSRSVVRRSLVLVVRSLPPLSSRLLVRWIWKVLAADADTPRKVVRLPWRVLVVDADTPRKVVRMPWKVLVVDANIPRKVVKRVLVVDTVLADIKQFF
jgi:hypothetical protein